MRSLLRPSTIALLALGVAAGCRAGNDPSTLELDASDLPETAGFVCGNTSDAGIGADGGLEGDCFWQTSDWLGDDWLEYPGKATVVIPHPLGRVPTVILTYISFEPNAKGGTLASGDLARIQDVTPTVVAIENDTKTDYFLRVVLE